MHPKNRTNRYSVYTGHGTEIITFVSFSHSYSNSNIKYFLFGIQNNDLSHLQLWWHQIFGPYDATDSELGE